MLLFLQVLLLDNLHWLGLVHPFIYIWAIILLPIELPRWLQMLIGAAIGIEQGLDLLAEDIVEFGGIEIFVPGHAFLEPLTGSCINTVKDSARVIRVLILGVFDEIDLAAVI